MRFFLKISILLVSAVILTALILASLKGGDMLIDYLAGALYFRIHYENRCGFVSAFILKEAELKRPVLEGLDNPLVIKGDNLLVKFDYSRLITKGAIGLHCAIEKPLFKARPLPKSKEPTLMDVIQEELFAILGEAADFQYDNIFSDLLLYGDTVEILDFTAYSRDIILMARGKAEDNGKADIKIKILFSPGFVADFKDQASVFLSGESGGWMSSEMSIQGSVEAPFLRVETDKFALSIGNSDNPR